jgi:hypothetical protein
MFRNRVLKRRVVVAVISAMVAPLMGGECRKSPAEYRREADYAKKNQSESVCDSSQVIPARTDNASGTIVLHKLENGEFMVILGCKILSSSVTEVHFHEGSLGKVGPILFDFPKSGFQVYNAGEFDANCNWRPNPSALKALKNGTVYVDIHTTKYPDGEIRGQIQPVPAW